MGTDLRPQSIVRTVNRWFFAEIDVRQYAVLRIGIGILLVIYLYQLLSLSTFHFSAQGWLSHQQTVGSYNPYRWSLLYLVNQATEVRWFWWLAMLSAVFFTLGYKTRISGGLTWLALVSIWHRNPLVLDGDDIILRMVLLYLLFSGCGGAYSLDAISKRSSTVAAVWPLRMIQIQLCLLYFVSGWVKLTSLSWMQGDILSVVLQHPQYARWNFTTSLQQSWPRDFIRYVSVLIGVWELCFPWLLMQKHTRFACLLFGIFFHLSLLLLMQLRWFAIIMLVLYVAFLPNDWFRRSLPRSIAPGNL